MYTTNAVGAASVIYIFGEKFRMDTVFRCNLNRKL